MITLPINRETTSGETLQLLTGGGKPIFACMYIDGQTQLTTLNYTPKEEPSLSYEGKLIIEDDQGNVIQTRVAFCVAIEEGAHFNEFNELVVTSKGAIEFYWNEFTKEILRRGLTM